MKMDILTKSELDRDEEAKAMAQQQRAALERTFYHDINNMLSALVGASVMLSFKKHYYKEERSYIQPRHQMLFSGYQHMDSWLQSLHL